MSSQYRERAKAAMASTLPTRETQILLGSIFVAAVLSVLLVGRSSPSHDTWVLGLMMLALSTGFIVRALPRRKLSSEQALFLVELGDLDGAAEGALRTLRARLPGEAQARAWLVLARCAEIEGDFDDAEELLKSTLSLVDDSSFLGREIAARRAFALAAVGREREASALLDLEVTRQGPFRTAQKLSERTPLETRAVLLCLHRSKDAAGAREVFDAEGPAAFRELCARDRALVRRVGAWAGAPTPRSFGEEQADIVRWVDGLVTSSARTP